MNRRDWLKSLAALAIASRIPVKEVTAFAPTALAIPVGYIFQMFDANGGTVHILKTDHGFEKIMSVAKRSYRYAGGGIGRRSGDDWRSIITGVRGTLIKSAVDQGSWVGRTTAGSSPAPHTKERSHGI